MSSKIVDSFSPFINSSYVLRKMLYNIVVSNQNSNIWHLSNLLCCGDFNWLINDDQTDQINDQKDSATAQNLFMQSHSKQQEEVFEDK